MATGDPDGLSYPLPFASDASGAWVASPDAYVASLVAAGFDVAEPIDRTQLALEATAAAAPPAPAGVVGDPHGSRLRRDVREHRRRIARWPARPGADHRNPLTFSGVPSPRGRELAEVLDRGRLVVAVVVFVAQVT